VTDPLVQDLEEVVGPKRLDICLKNNIHDQQKAIEIVSSTGPRRYLS